MVVVSTAVPSLRHRPRPTLVLHAALRVPSGTTSQVRYKVCIVKMSVLLFEKLFDPCVREPKTAARLLQRRQRPPRVFFHGDEGSNLRRQLVLYTYGALVHVHVVGGERIGGRVLVWFADPAPVPAVQHLALLLVFSASRALSPFVSFRFVSLRLSPRLLCLLF